MLCNTCGSTVENENETLCKSCAAQQRLQQTSKLELPPFQNDKRKSFNPVTILLSLILSFIIAYTGIFAYQWWAFNAAISAQYEEIGSEIEAANKTQQSFKQVAGALRNANEVEPIVLEPLTVTPINKGPSLYARSREDIQIKHPATENSPTIAELKQLPKFRNKTSFATTIPTPSLYIEHKSTAAKVSEFMFFVDRDNNSVNVTYARQGDDVSAEIIDDKGKALPAILQDHDPDTITLSLANPQPGKYALAIKDESQTTRDIKVGIDFTNNLALLVSAPNSTLYTKDIATIAARIIDLRNPKREFRPKTGKVIAEVYAPSGKLLERIELNDSGKSGDVRVADGTFSAHFSQTEEAGEYVVIVRSALQFFANETTERSGKSSFIVTTKPVEEDPSTVKHSDSKNSDDENSDTASQ